MSDSEQQPRKQWVPIIITLIITIGIVAIAFFYLKTKESKPQSTVSTTSSSKPSTSMSSTSTTQITSSTTTTDENTISVFLNSPINGQTVNGTLQVRAIVEGATQGTCNVILSQKGQKDITLKTKIVAAPTYYACDGFDIPLDTFPQKGEWLVQVQVASANSKGQSEQRKITVS